MATVSQKSLVRWAYAIVLVMASVLFFGKLSGDGLARYDDAYYAQKAKELLKSGDPMTLTYDGQPSFDNPPFFMWMVAGSYKIFGISEYAARFPSAVMGLLEIALIMGFGSLLFSPFVGLLAGSVLSLTTIFIKYSRHGMIDVTLSFYVTLALLFLYLGLSRNRKYLLGWALASAIGIMSKSVLGSFPLLIGVAYICLLRRWRVFKWPIFWLSFLGALALGGSWHIHQYLVHGWPFVQEHFIDLIFGKSAKLDPDNRYFYFYYLKTLGMYYWPWLPLLIWGAIVFVRNSIQLKPAFLLISLWFFVVLGVLSSSHTTKTWYFIPALPAAAVMVAYVLAQWLGESRKQATVMVLIGMTAIIHVVVDMLPSSLAAGREVDVRLIAPYVKQVVKPDEPLYRFRQAQFALNNTLLFYADRAAKPLGSNIVDMVSVFASPKRVFAIVSLKDLPELQNNVKGLFVVKQGTERALVANRPVDASFVYTLERQ
jgi:4-amino-4-deoxy-L-arabinose transferase-like glycosyltransferase